MTCARALTGGRQGVERERGVQSVATGHGPSINLTVRDRGALDLAFRVPPADILRTLNTAVRSRPRRRS